MFNPQAKPLPLKAIKKPKRIRQISNKKKERLKNEPSERNFFYWVLIGRWKECEACWKEVLYPTAISFAHKLSKTKYSQFKFIDENIAIVCWDNPNCHKKIDSIYTKEKRKEFEEYLTYQYLTK